MKCELLHDLLDDYVDGLLPERTATHIREHLARCADCRAEESALRALVSAAVRLPTEIEPERELWDGIAARLEKRRPTPLPHTGTASRGHWYQGLAAASLLLALLGLGYAYLPRPAAPSSESPAASRPTAEIPAVRSPAGHPSGIHAAEQALIEAKLLLRDALDARRGELSAETIEMVNRNARIIEDAIAEIRASLARDPGNRDLNQMLIAAHQQEVALLQHVMRRAARL